MKILIVEDDTLLLQGLILAAQTEGYACDSVTTARMYCIFSPVSGRKNIPCRY